MLGNNDVKVRRKSHTPRKLKRFPSVEGEYEKQIKLKYYMTNSENAKEKQTAAKC